MKQPQLNTLFDQQAASYDARWAKTAPIRDALYLLLNTLFIELPANARILSVGVGTGTARAERDGFEHPLFYQAGLIHAWRSQKRRTRS